ncbi:hypothetical protein HDU76_006881 [Blyttiomyces sp. JEL0837]|nr:hypothetical protein HDU76_006881 [Blyttiomyces sp. JEL0837]
MQTSVYTVRKTDIAEVGCRRRVTLNLANWFLRNDLCVDLPLEIFHPASLDPEFFLKHRAEIPTPPNPLHPPLPPVTVDVYTEDLLSYQNLSSYQNISMLQSVPRSTTSPSPSSASSRGGRVLPWSDGDDDDGRITRCVPPRESPFSVSPTADSFFGENSPSSIGSPPSESGRLSSLSSISSSPRDVILDHNFHNWQPYQSSSPSEIGGNIPTLMSPSLRAASASICANLPNQSQQRAPVGPSQFHSISYHASQISKFHSHQTAAVAPMSVSGGDEGTWPRAISPPLKPRPTNYVPKYAQVAKDHSKPHEQSRQSEVEASTHEENQPQQQQITQASSKPVVCQEPSQPQPPPKSQIPVLSRPKEQPLESHAHKEVNASSTRLKEEVSAVKEVKAVAPTPPIKEEKVEASVPGREQPPNPPERRRHRSPLPRVPDPSAMLAPPVSAAPTSAYVPLSRTYAISPRVDDFGGTGSISPAMDAQRTGDVRPVSPVIRATLSKYLAASSKPVVGGRKS